jgi:hypothetical protein
MAKKMKLARQALKCILASLILCDLLIVWELYHYGPPIEFVSSQEAVPYAVTFTVKRVSPSAQDWEILGALLSLHAVLIYGIWRSRRS